jgi:curved DNA-binding protein CbpA
MLNYYSFLKISPDSTQEEIELAFADFKNELLKFSPGINLSEEELRFRKPEEWEAFDVLLNEERRKQYDEVLERDRIHELYEVQIKKEEEENLKKENKRKYYGLTAITLIIIAYFLLSKFSSDNLPKQPNWRTHYITDEVKIVLPAPIDSSDNIFPPFLLGYTKKHLSFLSQLSDGFSVTVGMCEMDGPYALSFKDAGYIGSREMQDMHRRFEKRDTVKLNIAIHNYRILLIKGSYQIDNIIRAYENYTLIKDNVIIKVIVNYESGNPDHEKYREIVFNSLMQ